MDKIDILLTRGVDKIYPNRQSLEKVLRSGKKLRLYQGFDPSGVDLHIGHMVGLRKLHQFQNLGHHVIFLIGDFTGMIGDPTGKSTTRKPLTQEQVLKNAQKYQQQAGKILNFTGKNAVEIKFNSKWLSQLTFSEVIKLSYHFTVQQMIERNMFQERIKQGNSISLVEFLYPLMVTYDAATMHVDLELGGSDQMFNMTVGRNYLKQTYNIDKSVMTTPLLTDSKGVKIGKTEGNVIALTDTPNDLYGKIMALSDDVILKGFEYLTDVPLDEIKKMEQAMKQGNNPMTFKKRLAHNIVEQLNSKSEADKAQAFFESTFQQSQLPTDQILTVTIPYRSGATITLLRDSNFAQSNSEARRLLEQGAVELNKKKLKNEQHTYKTGDILKVGKSGFVKLEVKK